MLAFAVLASCSKDPEGPDTPKFPVPQPGTTYQLEGTVATEGFAWTSSAVVGLYSKTDGVRASNLQCKIVGWVDPTPAEPDEEGNLPPAPDPSPYEGEAVARFDTPAMDLVQGKNTFLVYTPYNPELIYLNGTIYGLTVATEQTQTAPNVAGDCFSIGDAEGIAGVDEAFAFEMTPITAMAKFVVSSNEFVGYAPSKITVWDESGEAALTGGFNVAVEDLSFQRLETSSRASVSVKSPVALASGASQNIYLNMLPNDFTGKDLWIIVEFDSEEGHITIPMKKSNLSFTAGQVTEIDLTNIGREDNAAKEWYEPVEHRMLSGLGYAYGDANTYLIQCKNGSTYTGATYAEDADIPSEVVIDIKARGNFFNVVDPRGATFEWFKLGGAAGDGNGTGTVYTPRYADYKDATDVDPTQFEISYDGNTTVKVKNTGAYAGAPILLMIKDNKIIWSWAFWNVAADGTKLEQISVGSFKIANMDIGQATTQFETWTANKIGSNPDVVFRTAHYYQWGRAIPVFWTTYWSANVFSAALSGNCPALYGPLSLAETIANPCGVIVNETNGGDCPQWQTETVGDLWGNCNSDQTSVGKKSVYDPCPKGWRVADRAVFDYIVASCPSAGTGYSYVDTRGAAGISFNGNVFITSGYINGKTDANNGRMATMGAGNAGTVAATSHGLIWSNWIGGRTANQATAFYYRTSSGNAAPRIATYNRSIAGTVRCQVDEAAR